MEFLIFRLDKLPNDVNVKFAKFTLMHKCVFLIDIKFSRDIILKIHILNKHFIVINDNFSYIFQLAISFIDFYNCRTLGVFKTAT